MSCWQFPRELGLPVIARLNSNAPKLTRKVLSVWEVYQQRYTWVVAAPQNGCFPLCQRFRKFWLEFKWKSPSRWFPTGIFGITSGGGPLISVGIFQPKFVVPFLTNRFVALIREFGRETNSGKSHSYWLVWFSRKMLFHFARKFPLISDRSVWHNGKHPMHDPILTQTSARLLALRCLV